MTSPTTRTRTLALLAALTLAAAGCGSGGDPEPAPTTAAPTRPVAVEVECVSIERAHKAFQSIYRPTTADEWANASETQRSMALDAGQAFLDAVSGYDSQSSKALATAVSKFNADLALLNVELGLDVFQGESHTTVASAQQQVEIAFRSWKTQVCS